MEFRHRSVLLEETIENLRVKPEGIYVDGTLGGAGHALEVCKRLSAINPALANSSRKIASASRTASRRSLVIAPRHLTPSPGPGSYTHLLHKRLVKSFC